MPTALDIVRQLHAKRAWQARWVGITVPFTVHQSSLRTYQHCKRQAFYKLVVGEKADSLPAYLLIGSLVHYILESFLKGITPTPDLIRTWLIERCSTEQYDIDMSPDEIIRRVWDTEIYYGMALIDICRIVVVWLEAGQYEVKAVERKWSLKIHNVQFEGTIDVLAVRRIDGKSYNIIADFKAGGLTDKFFADGSVTAVSYKDEEVTHSNQFAMYDWAMYRLFGMKAHRYAYITPVNLVPRASGKDKGKPRGDLMWDQPALNIDQLMAFEDDLYKMVREIEYSHKYSSWPRSRPEVFGKLDCLRCPYKVACLGIRELDSGLSGVQSLPPHLRGVTP